MTGTPKKYLLRHIYLNLLDKLWDGRELGRFAKSELSLEAASPSVEVIFVGQYQ